MCVCMCVHVHAEEPGNEAMCMYVMCVSLRLCV